MSRLLLISCSARKRNTDIPLPASALYTGVFYRLLAKARRDQQMADDISVGIISAEHGFLEESDLLLPYERKMDEHRARFLQPTIAQRLDALILQGHPEQVLVAIGKTYRLGLILSQELKHLNSQGRVMEASGGIGQQLQAVHRWIRTPPS